MSAYRGPIDDDPWIRLALEEINDRYGVVASVSQKRKSLIKFGTTANADAGVRTTVGEFQGAVVNETFATGNTIDRVVSSSTSDTSKVVTIEGHTIGSDGSMTFVVQNATLTGQTAVTLTTPLARASRVYIKTGTYASPASSNVGTVYVYDNAASGGLSSGVPVTAAATKVLISPGVNQSQKCATTVSNTDYWIITEIYASLTRSGPQSSKATVQVEYREVGGVWRPFGFSCDLDQASHPVEHDTMMPFMICPKNADVRMVATSSINDSYVSGYIMGVLAKVI